jgi:hypothetical protein
MKRLGWAYDRVWLSEDDRKDFKTGPNPRGFLRDVPAARSGDIMDDLFDAEWMKEGASAGEGGSAGEGEGEGEGGDAQQVDSKS